MRPIVGNCSVCFRRAHHLVRRTTYTNYIAPAIRLLCVPCAVKAAKGGDT